MSNKNILYLSYDGMTDPLGQSQVLPYIVGLSGAGYKFWLISCEKEQRFQSNKNTIQKICDDNNIEWHPIAYTKSPPVLSTLIDIKKMWQKTLFLHKKTQFSLIHCRSYIPAIIGERMKKKFGIKFVFDMRGFYADERVDGGIWPQNNLIYKNVYRFFKRKEKDFLLNADYTVTLTNNGKNEILSWQYIDKKNAKIKVIPCCVDLNLFNPQNVLNENIGILKKELNIEDDAVVVSYVGSIGTWYMLDEMLDFFVDFLKLKPNSYFVFVTKDDKKNILIKAALKKINIQNIRVVSADRSQMPLYISISSFSLFFILPAFSKKASSPTKQGEIMAMGIPVVCNSGVGDTDFVVNKFNSGILIHSFTSKAYRESIFQLLNGKFEKMEIISGAKEFYSLEEGISSYVNIYKDLIDG